MNYSSNQDLYPTPKGLARKMIAKVKWNNVRTILEPSAGFGHLISEINEHSKYGRKHDISAIEIDNNCRNMLIKSGVNVIDSDFLLYNGLEQFDLIIANFPFSEGDKHLHKAIDILFSGQIVCLINAETIKNPYSNSRKELVQKLNHLNASIEYIKDGFLDADRKTGVEVALIYIEKIRDVETELFSNMDQNEEEFEDIEECTAVATKDNIGNIVKRYNMEKENVTSQIMEFYKNYKSVSKYLSLMVVGEELENHQKNIRIQNGELTEIMKSKLNNFSRRLKREYWLEAMKLDEISSRLTSKKKQELSSELNSYCNMDFTEANIKIFIENIIAKYPVMIDEAIEYIFDKFTEYAFRDCRNDYNEYKQNVHLYNGWKTNEAFKVNKKVILPFRVDGYGTNMLYSEKKDFLDDIDIVFNYFDDKGIENDLLEYKDNYSYSNDKIVRTKQTSTIVAHHLSQGITKNIVTRYFTLTLYKKGTVHFVFNDLEMLRKFNIYVAKKRGWLPMNYGYTKEKDTSVDFETVKEYKQIGHELSIAAPNALLLVA
jgi:phospholipid N-methyltransferase